MSNDTPRNAAVFLISTLGLTACGGGGSGGSSNGTGSGPATPDPDDRDNLLTITADNQEAVVTEALRGVLEPLDGRDAYQLPIDIVAFTRGFGTNNIGYRFAEDFDALKDPTNTNDDATYSCGDEEDGGGGTYTYEFDDEEFTVGSLSTDDEVTVVFENCIFFSDISASGLESEVDEEPTGAFTMTVLDDGETVAYDLDAWSYRHIQVGTNEGNQFLWDWTVDTTGRLEVSSSDEQFSRDMTFALAGEDALRIAYDFTGISNSGDPVDTTNDPFIDDASRTFTDMSEIRLRHHDQFFQGLEEAVIDVRFASFSDTFGGQFVDVETKYGHALESPNDAGIDDGTVVIRGDDSSVTANFSDCGVNEARLTLAQGGSTTTGDCVEIPLRSFQPLGVPAT